MAAMADHVRPFTGVERKSLFEGDTSVFDPKRTSFSYAACLLHKKGRRTLNQPVGRHDAYSVGDGHIEPVE